MEHTTYMQLQQEISEDRREIDVSPHTLVLFPLLCWYGILLEHQLSLVQCSCMCKYCVCKANELRPMFKGIQSVAHIDTNES